MVDDENIDFKWAKLTKNAQKCVSLYIKTGEKEASYNKAFNVKKKETLSVSSARFFKRVLVCEIIDYYREKARKSVAVPVEEVIEDAKKDVMDINQTIVDAQWVLKKAVMLANFNIRKFIKIDDDGNAFYDFSKATDDDWYCINEYTVKAETDKDGKVPVKSLKLKSESKLQALKMIGSHVEIKAFDKDDEKSDDDEVVDLLKEFINGAPS